MDEVSPPTPGPKGSPLSAGAAAFLTLGLTSAAAIVVGAVLGWVVGRWLGQATAGAVVGGLLGLTSAIWRTVRTVQKYL